MKAIAAKHMKAMVGTMPGNDVLVDDVLLDALLPECLKARSIIRCVYFEIAVLVEMTCFPASRFLDVTSREMLV